MWFADPVCEAEFAAPGDVGGGRLDELARCLALAKVALSPRKDALPDVVVLTYPPGIELEARFADLASGRTLTWVGYVSRHDVADALPTISPDALESLRLAGQRETPNADLQPPAYAWVKLCIDGEGTVTSTHVRQATSHKAARELVEATRDWKFKPFVPAGQPLPVCSVLVLGSPLAKLLETARRPASSASCGCASRRRCRATCAPRRRPPRCVAATGCSPATCASPTTRASSTTSTGASS